MKPILILLLLSFVFLMFGNGVIHLTNPDEVFYTQTAREMVQHNSWQVPYLFGQPQFEKPIFLYWLLRIGFILFGVTSLGARFFPALFAMAGVIAVYFFTLIGLKDEKKAFMSSLVLMSSVLYIGLARTVFTDMIFSVFIFLSLAAFFWGYIEAKAKKIGIILFFIFAALAVLSKGPLGIIIPLAVAVLFLAVKKEIKFLFCPAAAWGLALFSLIALPWYIFVIKKFGSMFINEFFYNDHYRRIIEAEHRRNDKWYFYPASMVLCMFPWSIFTAASFFYLGKQLLKKSAKPVYLFLACWIFVTFWIFQVAHSKLVSYIFPVFPALAVITGDYLCSAVSKNKPKIIKYLAWACLSIPLLLLAALVIGSMKYPEYLPSKTFAASFIAACGLIFIIMLFFAVKRKLLPVIYLSAFQIFVVLFFMFKAGESINIYASSKAACEFLPKEHIGDTVILCDKFLARGVRYFTDKNTAVIDINGKNFFSPHPVLYLNTDDKVRDLLKSQAVTYCVLTDSSYEDVRRMAGRELESELLTVIGDEYVARVYKK